MSRAPHTFTEQGVSRIVDAVREVENRLKAEELAQTRPPRGVVPNRVILGEITAVNGTTNATYDVRAVHYRNLILESVPAKRTIDPANIDHLPAAVGDFIYVLVPDDMETDPMVDPLRCETIETIECESINFAGSWADATAYARYQVVEDGGGSWVATSSHTSSPATKPSTGASAGTVWAVMAEKGEGVPPGGAAGEILRKVTATDFDTEWTPRLHAFGIRGPLSTVTLTTPGSWIAVPLPTVVVDVGSVFETNGANGIAATIDTIARIDAASTILRTSGNQNTEAAIRVARDPGTGFVGTLLEAHVQLADAGVSFTPVLSGLLSLDAGDELRLEAALIGGGGGPSVDVTVDGSYLMAALGV